MIDNITATTAREGLDFRFDLARPGNTFDAHRLLHLALEHGHQDELKERLDHATFTEGSRPSDHSDLRALATRAGLPGAEVGTASPEPSPPTPSWRHWTKPGPSARHSRW